jgi:hypothetical protein
MSCEKTCVKSIREAIRQIPRFPTMSDNRIDRAIKYELSSDGRAVIGDNIEPPLDLEKAPLLAHKAAHWLVLGCRETTREYLHYLEVRIRELDGSAAGCSGRPAPLRGAISYS